MAAQTAQKKGSVLAGIVWMFFISLLLFWLPVVGPLIAGVVGGKKSGGIGSAILAVFLPGIFFAALLFIFATTLTGFPVIGVAAGTGGFILSISQVGTLLLGAIMGGILAEE